MEKYALELKNIYHEFETTIAVSNLSISIKQGEVVCLLGPSGCGKSTTLRLAAGLEKVQAGEVLLNGDLVSSVNFQVPPEQRDVGLVFQDYALFPHLSVIENTKFGLKENSIILTASDAGWINGHTYSLIGPLLIGSTTVLLSKPTFLLQSKILILLLSLKLTILYLPVTLIRLLRAINNKKQFKKYTGFCSKGS